MALKCYSKYLKVSYCNATTELMIKCIVSVNILCNLRCYESKYRKTKLYSTVALCERRKSVYFHEREARKMGENALNRKTRNLFVSQFWVVSLSRTEFKSSFKYISSVGSQLIKNFVIRCETINFCNLIIIIFDSMNVLWKKNQRINSSQIN